MFKNKSIVICFFLLLSTQWSISQKTCFLIDQAILYIDAKDLAYKNVRPGDTLFFAPGNRKYLLIKNFQGQPGKPIVMMNTGGDVIIDSDNYYGISFQNCSQHYDFFQK